MRFRSSLRSDSGATSIEYAILAGLIGLGLVASLVTTKGSLSSVFGTASSQMSSSTALSDPAASAGGSSSGPSATAPATINWKGRTLSAPAVKTVYDANMTYWTYNFTDGTTATFYRGASGGSTNTIYMDERPVGGVYTGYSETTSGSPMMFNVTAYSGGKIQSVDSTGSNNGAGFNGTTPQSQRTQIYNASGQVTSDTGIVAASSTFKAQAAQARTDFAMFSAASQ